MHRLIIYNYRFRNKPDRERNNIYMVKKQYRQCKRHSFNRIREHINGVNLTNTTGSPVTVTFSITPTGPGATACQGDPITATVIVDPASIGGTAIDPIICAGSAGTVNLSGNSGSIQWQQSADDINFVNVSGGLGANSSSYTSPDLSSSTYYRAQVTSGVCPAAYSTPVSHC